MKIKFLIEDKETDGSAADVPKLGVMEGYVQEGINMVTLVELIVVSDLELTEDDCEEIVGQNAVIALGDEVDGEFIWSRFDGVIFELSVLDEYQVESSVFPYKIVIRPPLWRLNFQTQYRSFQGRSRIEVVDDVLKEHKLEKSVAYDTAYFAAEKDYPALTQIVQNETTDLRFFEQLLQEGGINFFFCAPKDGEEPEKMILLDHNAFFKEVWTKEIMWKPQMGMTVAQRVTTFETHVHTTPSAVETHADMGDGMTRTFSSTGEVEGGKGGTHTLFSREGQDEKVAKHTANVLTQGFVANKVTYNGTSNHLAIRTGEKVKIKGNSNAKEKEILITSIRHSFKQTVASALSNNAEISYENVFAAVRKDAPVRPPQFGTSHAINTALSQRDKAPSQSMDRLVDRLEKELDVKFFLDTDKFPAFDVQQSLLDMLDRLSRMSAHSGVWVGKVIESAKVTDGSELTCRVANKQFPETDSGGGLTAKIALGWLTNNGWFSVLPRKDNYVYFTFMQGEGGQNEPVVIGYRPTSAVKTLDPAKTQKTPKLALGEPPELGAKAEKVVEKAEYEPSNQYRNTLRGEEGVAEVAVIDGGDDAVAVYAKNGIHMVADEELHMDAPIQAHLADELHQQFGLVNRGVTGNQKESIAGAHELTVMGNQNEFVGGAHKRHVEKEITIDNNGEDDITIANGEDNMFVLHKGEQAVMKANDGNSLAINKSGAIDITAEKQLNLAAEKNTAVANAEGIKLTVGGNVINITKSSGIEITAGTGVKISGGQVEIKGSAKVAITGGAEVSVTGATVNLN